MLHIIVFATLSIIVESLYNKFYSSSFGFYFYSIPWIGFYIISQFFPPRNRFIIFTVLNFLLAMGIGIFGISLSNSNTSQQFKLKDLVFIPYVLFMFMAPPLTLFYATSLIVSGKNIMC